MLAPGLSSASHPIATLNIANATQKTNNDNNDKTDQQVKTILHELCKLKGTAIYSFTGLIPSAGGSSASGGGGGSGGAAGGGDARARPIIFPYIDLNIQTLQQNGVIGGASGGPSARSTGAGGGWLDGGTGRDGRANQDGTGTEN